MILDEQEVEQRTEVSTKRKKGLGTKDKALKKAKKAKKAKRAKKLSKKEGGEEEKSKPDEQAASINGNDGESMVSGRENGKEGQAEEETRHASNEAGSGDEEESKSILKKGAAYRDAHSITVIDPLASQPDEVPGDAYAPLTTFEEVQGFFHKSCRHLFEKAGYFGKFEKPTPIQAQSWPILFNSTRRKGQAKSGESNGDGAGKRKRDLVGIAETGSGKTLAFAFPIVASTLYSFYKKAKAKSGSSKDLGLSRRSVCSPKCLVLSPTRELAIQSHQVFSDLIQSHEQSSAKSRKTKTPAGQDRKMISLVVYGGEPRYKQAQLLKGADVLAPSNAVFIVATVGRLLDFMESGDIDVEQIEYLVLDEADRMLDMGFEQEVKRIIKRITTPTRLTVMFSATWPVEIRKIAQVYMKDPLRITIGSESLSANKRVEQNIIVLEPFSKERRLSNLLMELNVKKSNKKVIVFALYKKESARLEGFLQRQNYRAAAIHGDKTQKLREEALQGFLQGRFNILVATDVASRGLDIKDVSVVINHTFPLTIEDYVHRIGRTGRAGANGISYTFFTNHEKHLAGALQNVLRQNGVDIPPELKKFGNTVKKKTHGMYGAHFRSNDDTTMMKKASHIKF